jgi:hypothetical protein
MGGKQSLRSLVRFCLEPMPEQQGTDRMKRGAVEVRNAFTMDAGVAIRAEAKQVVQ